MDTSFDFDPLEEGAFEAAEKRRLELDEQDRTCWEREQEAWLIDRPNTATDEKLLKALGLVGPADALPKHDPDKEAYEKAYEVWKSRCEDSSAQEAFAETFKTFKAEREHSAIEVQAVASPEQEAGLIDTDQADRMLKALGITKVIACAYGATNHYTPRRRQDGRYLWDSMPAVVDWAAVERDLQRPGDWSLGFISCPGGTRTLDRPGRPAEIFECSLLVYEIDSIAKADQWKLWEQAGLPEPTLVMDSGRNSLHVWYRLAAPVSVEQGRIARERLAAAITEVLPGEAKADTSMVSPHQPARLAGGIHPKTGERSTIVLETGNVFELDALMALCRELPEKVSSDRTGTIWRDDEDCQVDRADLPELPLSKPVPLSLALGNTTVELIASGMEPGQGGRRVAANRLSKTLQAAEAQLQELGQPFEGSALELWQQFLERSNSDGDLDDVDQVYDAHWEQDHIGEGDLSQAGLLLRLRQFAIDNCGWDPDHWIKNPAPGGWIARARAFTQQNLEKLRELCSEGNRRNRERVVAKEVKAVRPAFSTLMEKLYDAVVKEDEDREMSIRAELWENYRCREQTVEIRLFKLLQKRAIGFKPNQKTKRRGVSFRSIAGTEWKLPGFLPSNDITLVWGMRGSGKTRLALEISVQGMQGQGLLDRPANLNPTKVLFIASDSGGDPLKEELQDMGFDVDNDPLFDPSTDLFELWCYSQEEQQEAWGCGIRGRIELFEWAKANKGAVVVMDSAKAITAKGGCDYTDNATVTEFMTFLKECVCPFVTVLVVAHDGTRPGRAGGAAAWEEIPSMVIGCEKPKDEDGKPMASQRLLTVHKSRKADERGFSYKVAEDGRLALCPGAEVVGDMRTAIVNQMVEWWDQGRPTATTDELVEALRGKRFMLSRKTVQNNCSDLIRGKTPKLQRVKGKQGTFKVNPYWLRSNR
ncbi:DNA/RNA polymerases family protein [Synechococcus sp. MEDNS5]|uniref:AAA family ATPase n=1 Tax=Synechococcus sp. MEDNS5 TaxID=1442554 RepID=UPI001647E303|nr:AAA family ATPase [Synechococcus sp. MEDNS5]QNJ06280.1 DNA/RNA polymerases family protein [Synechococcus sp. MEDNS5]